MSYELPSVGWSLEIRVLERRRKRSIYLMQKMNESIRCLATTAGALRDRVSLCHVSIMQAQPVGKIDGLTRFNKAERALIKQRFADLLVSLGEAFKEGAPPMSDEHGARFAEEILTLNDVLSRKYE